MQRCTTFTVAAVLWLGYSFGVGSGISSCMAAGPSPAGKWLGVIKTPDAELRIAFEISQTAEGGYSAVAHSIDQGAMNIPITTVTATADGLRLELKSVFAYEGKFQPDGDTIDGNWIQNDSTPLVMKRVDKIPELNRPQNPKKPYPYDEEEVTYPSSAANVRIAGTLTIPRGKGPFPAVLLIAGSGRSDRDESVLGHKPFLVLADHLTRRGIAVLRVDKRGIGKSTGTFEGSGIKEFASDALAGVEYLKHRKEVDPRRIGLVGHSEGGSVAPMVAAQSADVSYLVLLAAPGMSAFDILVLQDGTEAKAAGCSDEQVSLIRGFSRRYYGIVLRSKDAAEVERETNALYASLTDAEKKAIDWPNLHGTLSLAWGLDPTSRGTLESDIRPTLRQVQCPVLALNGGMDAQVPAKENLADIEEALKAGGNKDHTLRELPGLNHLFQTCRTGAVSEYIKIEETMSPTVLQIVSDWILANAGDKSN
ncbi:MAG: alpha/beta fold hydrolase [Phycisphaerales bacterium]